VVAGLAVAGLAVAGLVTAVLEVGALAAAVLATAGLVVAGLAGLYFVSYTGCDLSSTLMSSLLLGATKMAAA
jgi:hypothetical protein